MPDELAMGSDLGVAEPELADAPLPFTRLAETLRPRRPMTPACTHSQGALPKPRGLLLSQLNQVMIASASMPQYIKLTPVGR